MYLIDEELSRRPHMRYVGITPLAIASLFPRSRPQLIEGDLLSTPATPP
jgi:hypothetical protein